MSQQVMYRRCEWTKLVSDGVLIQQSDVERPENVLVTRSRDHLKHQKNDGRV
jgi:hypothetical protein